MDKIRKHPYILLTSFIFLIVGIFLIVVDAKEIINFVYNTIGVLCILSGILKIYISSRTSDDEYLFDGVINIAVGVALLFFHNFVVTLILGLLFVAFPIIRIFKSKDKLNAFQKELPLLIIGLVIILSGDLLADVFLKIVGILFILYAIYLFISIFIGTINIFIFDFKKKKQKEKYKEQKRRTEYNDENIIDAQCEEREI